MNHVIAVGAEGSPVRQIQEHPFETLEQLKRFKNLLRIIAYPKRGTPEEEIDIFQAAELIRENYTLEMLED